MNARAIRLCLRMLVASWPRAVALSLLVAISVVVLLTVTELSRVSREGLDEAISSDVGDIGTYQVHVTTGLGLATEDIVDRVTKEFANVSLTPLTVARTYGPVRSECPPLDALGEQPIAVVTEWSGKPVDLPYGQDLPEEVSFCLDGVSVPESAVYLPDDAHQRLYGAALYVHPYYRDLVTASGLSSDRVSMILQTGVEGQEDYLTDRAAAALEVYEIRSGVPMDRLVTVVRTDRGDDLYKASAGVSAVYAAIGWGVVLLAGLALLVAQSIRVQQRLWFFGLARALGAGRRDIAALIATDVVVVVALGVGVAVGVSVAIQPLVTSFAQESFGLEASLLSNDSLAPLLGGALAMLFVATIPPVLTALRQDPLDVLEVSGG